MSKKTDKPAGKGHNKPPKVGGIAVEQLMSVIERAENILEEKAAALSDLRDIMNEAKGNGFDVRAIKECIKQRAMDAAEREERETVLDTYRRALGLIPTLDETI